MNILPGVILAAGAGSRFAGGNKLLLPWRDRPLICHALQAALNSRLAPVLLVVGYQGERLLAALESLRDDPKLEVLHNQRWCSGRASSVRLAIGALPTEAHGALFLLGDMPLMSSHLIDLVRENFLRSEARICFPVYQGHKGHPVAFSRELLGELARLRGDRSGWGLAQRYWSEALKIPLQNGATQLDVDTEEDYRRLLEPQ